MAMNRLREQRIDAPAFDLLRDETDTDEDGDEQPKHRRRGQPEILDDLDILARGELPDHVGRPDEHDREQHEVVEDLVADRFAKDVDGDGACGSHASSPRVDARTSGAVTCWTKKSSRVWRIGFSDTRCAPATVSSATRCSGAGSSARSSM